MLRGVCVCERVNNSMQRSNRAAQQQRSSVQRSRPAARARRSAAQRSATQHSAARRSAARRSAARRSAARRSAAQRSAAQRSAAQRGAAQRSAALGAARAHMLFSNRRRAFGGSCAHAARAQTVPQVSEPYSKLPVCMRAPVDRPRDDVLSLLARVQRAPHLARVACCEEGIPHALHRWEAFYGVLCGFLWTRKRRGRRDKAGGPLVRSRAITATPQLSMLLQRKVTAAAACILWWCFMHCVWEGVYYF